MPDRVKASTVQTTDDSEQPSWDTTPIGLRFWLNSMPEYVEDVDQDLVTLVESGYVMEKSIVVEAPLRLAVAATAPRHLSTLASAVAIAAKRASFTSGSSEV